MSDKYIILEFKYISEQTNQEGILKGKRLSENWKPKR